MATIFAHALLGVAAARVAYPADRNNRIAAWAAALSMLPDLDVLAFPLGIHYADVLGHRGLSHSPAFAFAMSALLVATVFREVARFSLPWWRLIAFFFLVTASHGVLDAMTNGGLGVAFFSPFDNARYFLPWTPLEVAPIGRAFFSRDGLDVLANEALWIGLPCAVALAAAHLRDARRTRTYLKNQKTS